MISRLQEAMAFTPENGARPADLHPALQIMMRKYGISQSPRRLAHFVGQISAETGSLRSTVEQGRDAYFSKYHRSTDQGRKVGNTELGDEILSGGRGVLQITGRFNYVQDGKCRGASYLNGDAVKLLESNADLACGTAGHYWASKQRFKKIGSDLEPWGKLSINFWVDLGTGSLEAEGVTRCVNAATLHFQEIRWPSFVHALYFLSDSVLPASNFLSLKI